MSGAITNLGVPSFGGWHLGRHVCMLVFSWLAVAQGHLLRPPPSSSTSPSILGGKYSASTAFNRFFGPQGTEVLENGIGYQLWLVPLAHDPEDRAMHVHVFRPNIGTQHEYPMILINHGSPPIAKDRETYDPLVLYKGNFPGM